MPTIDLSEEELQGLVQICATGSGPGINWMLTNAILSKARQAQEASAARAQGELLPPEPRRKANSEDHDAPLSRRS